MLNIENDAMTDAEHIDHFPGGFLLMLLKASGVPTIGSHGLQFTVCRFKTHEFKEFLQ